VKGRASLMDKPTVLTTPDRSEKDSLDVLISDIYGGHLGSAKRDQVHRLFQIIPLSLKYKNISSSAGFFINETFYVNLNNKVDIILIVS